MASLRGTRILYVVTKSNWGGAQCYVHALAVAAKREGAEVAVALGGTGRPGSDTGLLASRLASDDVPTIVLSRIGRDIAVFSEWHAFTELLRIVRRERPEVLHLNSSKAGLLGALAGRIAGVPRIVFTAHGWPHREPRSVLWRALVWLGSWMTVVLSHAVIVVSEHDRTTSPTLFSKRKIHRVHNGIASFMLEEREAARRFLAPSLPLEKLTKWLVIPAELARNKGIDLAIRAFAGVSTNIDDAALLIAGEGEEHARLLALIKSYGLEKRAFLLGFVPDVRRYLRAADIFLMPSRKEGFPLALLEAGYAGLPAIASRTGGIPEIVEDGRSGILIRPGDIDGLADAMTRLLTHPDEASRMGTALKETVTTRYSEEAMLSATFARY